MITGFEVETEPLTKYEERVLPYVVEILSKAKGKQNAVNNPRVCDLINHEYAVYFTAQMFTDNFRLTGVRLRKIIHHIRCNDLVKRLCSNSKEYYIGDKKECEDYMKGLRERLSAIEQVERSVRKQYREEYSEQIKLEL